MNTFEQYQFLMQAGVFHIMLYRVVLILSSLRRNSEAETIEQLISAHFSKFLHVQILENVSKLHDVASSLRVRLVFRITVFIFFFLFAFFSWTHHE